MFCEECGGPLKKGEKFCGNCAAGTPEAVEQEESIRDHKNNSASDNSLIHWDLDGFPKPKKTEDLSFDWRTGDFIPAEDKNFENETAQSINSKESDSNDSNVNNVSDLTKDLNKYFTFDKSNAEFQKLLDREYERINKYSQPINSNIYIERSDTEDSIDEKVEDSNIVDAIESSLHYITEAESEIGTGLKTGSEIGTGTGLKTGSEGLETGFESIIQSNNELVPEDISDNLIHGIDRKEEPESLSQETFNKISEESEESIVINSEQDETEDEPEVIWISEATVHSDKTAVKSGVNSEDIVEELQKEEGSGVSETLDADRSTNPLEKENLQKVAPLWFENSKEQTQHEQKKKKGGWLGKAILIIVIAILLAESTILGIQYFFPASSAAEKSKEINGIISETLIGWKEQTIDFFKGSGEKQEVGSEGIIDTETEPFDPTEEEDTDTGQDEDQRAEPNPTPSTNKDELIAALAERNKNIITVKSNDNLAWSAEKDYATADIENSKPVENNHWTTDSSGEHIYYDKEIIATLMEFDSKWIDYVNEGDDAVIDLTKEGSQARKNAVSSSKVGKVEQSFLLLEIGEIRQGENSFYAWTYEEIEETRSGKTKVIKYNWIYHLEPVDNEMKIVRYYSY